MALKIPIFIIKGLNIFIHKNTVIKCKERLLCYENHKLNTHTNISYCHIFMRGSDSSGSKSKITKLNIVTGNTAFVKSANNLAQVAPGGSSVKSVYKSTSSTDELNDVTTEDGDTVTVSSAIQVNDKYVLLQNLTTTDGETTEDDYILDVVTGETTALSIWPDNSKRVAASMDNLYAYYVSGGALYEVSLATGDTTLISDTTNYYAYNPAGGYKITTGSWSGSRLVFLG